MLLKREDLKLGCTPASIRESLTSDFDGEGARAVLHAQKLIWDRCAEYLKRHLAGPDGVLKGIHHPNEPGPADKVVSALDALAINIMQHQAIGEPILPGRERRSLARKDGTPSDALLNHLSRLVSAGVLAPEKIIALGAVLTKEQGLNDTSSMNLSLANHAERLTAMLNPSTDSQNLEHQLLSHGTEGSWTRMFGSMRDADSVKLLFWVGSMMVGAPFKAEEVEHRKHLSVLGHELGAHPTGDPFITGLKAIHDCCVAQMINADIEEGEALAPKLFTSEELLRSGEDGVARVQKRTLSTWSVKPDSESLCGPTLKRRGIVTLEQFVQSFMWADSPIFRQPHLVALPRIVFAARSRDPELVDAVFDKMNSNELSFYEISREVADLDGWLGKRKFEGVEGNLVFRAAVVRLWFMVEGTFFVRDVETILNWGLMSKILLDARGSEIQKDPGLGTSRERPGAYLAPTALSALSGGDRMARFEAALSNLGIDAPNVQFGAQNVRMSSGLITHRPHALERVLDHHYNFIGYRIPYQADTNDESPQS